jgi:hypothetical protein
MRPTEWQPEWFEKVAAHPRWAGVAFGARCARRILPLLQLDWSIGDDIKAVENTVHLAEEPAAKGSASDGIHHAAGLAAGVSGLAADASCRLARDCAGAAFHAAQAAESNVHAAKTDATYACGNACDAIREFAARHDFSERLRRARPAGESAPFLSDRLLAEVAAKPTLGLVTQDYQRLPLIVREISASGEALISPTSFGPLWPNSIPPGWPNTTEP